MSDAYDLVVIGAGPGGYVAAIRAAQNGLKTACIDKRGALGGTCLNVGCIPSKALLHSTELYEMAHHDFDGLGIETKKVEMNIEKLMAYKTEVVDGLTGGIDFLFQKNKVTRIDGTATITAPGKVSVALNDGGAQELEAKNILIATGSEPASLPFIEIDEERVVSSTGALALPEVPKKMVMIGAGVIGLELGSVWARLGSQVTVIEFLDRITPGMDSEIAKQFQRTLKKQGFDFKLSTKVTGVERKGDSVTVTAEPVKGGDVESYEADVVLVAIGRKPYTDGLGLDAVGVKMTDRGVVEVDHNFKTNVDGIYAIGDVIPGPMLAHKAEDEGLAVADHLAGKWSHVNYGVIPGVIYTHPEVASVGKTEEELKEAGIAYTKGKFPFAANSRAKAIQQTEGFVKVLASKDTDLVLGVHIIGPGAGELIGEAGMAMELGASSEDMARTCHAHPTMSEAVKEAAMSTTGKPVHS